MVKEIDHGHAAQFEIATEFLSMAASCSVRDAYEGHVADSVTWNRSSIPRVYLDKLVDELAKDKAMEKILRQ